MELKKMNYFGVFAILACVGFSGASTDYSPIEYRPVYRYNLTLNTGNHSFSFQGLTKITLNVNGQNFSYTNLTTYGSSNNYTKQVVLDFSLDNGNVRNVSIEWDYKWIDFPEILIFQPLLLVNRFTITPIKNPRRKIKKRSLSQETNLDYYDYNGVLNHDLNSPIYDPKNRISTKFDQNRLIQESNILFDAERERLPKPISNLDTLGYNSKVGNSRYDAIFNDPTRPVKLNRPFSKKPITITTPIESTSLLTSTKPIRPHHKRPYPIKSVRRLKSIKFCPVSGSKGIEAKISVQLVRCS